MWGGIAEAFCTKNYCTRNQPHQDGLLVKNDWINNASGHFDAVTICTQDCRSLLATWSLTNNISGNYKIILSLDTFMNRGDTHKCICKYSNTSTSYYNIWSILPKEQCLQEVKCQAIQNKIFKQQSHKMKSYFRLSVRIYSTMASTWSRLFGFIFLLACEVIILSLLRVISDQYFQKCNVFKK